MTGDEFLAYVKENRDVMRDYTLFIFQGAPGSGKSTLARKLGEILGCTPREADDYMTENGVYKFNPDKLSQAHFNCIHQVYNDLVYNDNDVAIVSNTNSRDKEVERYIELADVSCGAKYYIIRMETQYQNVHNVPADVVEAMRNRIKDSKIQADFIIHE